MENKGLVITSSSLFVIIIGLILYVSLWADDVAYNKAVALNTIGAYKSFISKYPQSNHIEDVYRRYDQTAFILAKKTNTEYAYAKYLEDHPNSMYVDSIKPLLEKFAYDRAESSSDLKDWRKFLTDYPGSTSANKIQKKIDKYEKDYYQQYINIADDKLSKHYLNNYNIEFPNGKYASIVVNKLKVIDDIEAYNSAKTTGTKYAWESYLQNYPQGKFASRARAKIREFEEIERYANYSLSNGATPYSQWYGSSNYCSSWYCSEIVITAPYNSDVVAFIKNASGNVVRHAFIRAGRSYTFNVPDGTYQPYFYYGKGWYPKKQMAKGRIGGFLKNETTSYVRATYLDSQIWTIQLELTTGGNLSSHSCSESDIF